VPTKVFGVPNTITVDSTDDEDGSCTNKKCTLRQAINDATAGATIIFDDSILPGTIVIDDTLGELTIDQESTIHNTDKFFTITISGNGASRIFHVSYFGSLTLDNLILTEGFPYGGAIWNEGGDVTVEKCRFEANGTDGSVIASSGSLLNDEGTAIVKRSVFTTRILRQLIKKHTKQPYQPENLRVSSSLVFTQWVKEKAIGSANFHSLLAC